MRLSDFVGFSYTVASALLFSAVDFCLAHLDLCLVPFGWLSTAERSSFCICFASRLQKGFPGLLQGACNRGRGDWPAPKGHKGGNAIVSDCFRSQEIGRQIGYQPNRVP